MSEQIIIQGSGTVLEFKDSKMTFESGATSALASDKLQQINHTTAGALTINPDQGHFVNVSAFANITSIVVNVQSSLLNGASELVVNVKANAALTLDFTGLTPAAGQTLSARTMQVGDVHLLVIWSDNWTNRKIALTSLVVVD